MRNNRNGLRKLREDLEKLKMDIDNASIEKSTVEQVHRLMKTSEYAIFNKILPDCPQIHIFALNSDLKGIIATCKELGQNRKIDQFLKSQSIATQIADVRQSVRDTLQAFQVRITTRSSVLNTDFPIVQTSSIITIEDKVGLINKDAEYGEQMRNRPS